MTDLVKRLRHAMKLPAAGAFDSTMREAADEIERLEDEIRVYLKEPVHVERMQAVVEAAREYLNKGGHKRAALAFAIKELDDD